MPQVHHRLEAALFLGTRLVIEDPFQSKAKSTVNSDLYVG
jgi:hypothetical protein